LYVFATFLFYYFQRKYPYEIKVLGGKILPVKKKDVLILKISSTSGKKSKTSASKYGTISNLA
jgi:hypothetical protein